jgi:CubicO group peptidase (beta-lactamase class C family)
VTAQDKAPDIDKIFSWAKPGLPGCTVAVSQHGKLLVNRAFGSADLERDVPITTNTIFDIGSVTKQFVAAAVLILAEDGRLSLSDDIRQHIPELPDFGHKVTVNHLLTHTGGIRDWTGIAGLSSRKTDNTLDLILRQRGLNFTPGEEWAYSNSGYVLAREIVARKSGTSVAEFMRQRLFEPLGMKSTVFSKDTKQVIKNRALAYQKEGDRWRLAMLEGDRGGGGVFSTAGDLLIWNDALTNGRLGQFVTQKIHEPATLNNGRKLFYARGLFVGGALGRRMISHSGSADGYKTLLVRFPDHGLSIAILCNSGDGTDRIAFADRLFELFVPNETKPAQAQSQSVAVDVPDLDARAGLFFSEPNRDPLQLIVNDGRLRVAGGPALVPLAKDRFRNPRGTLAFMSQDEFELHFRSPDELELKSMEGKSTRYRRAAPYSPTADDLKSLAGRFESDEIGTVFRIEPQEEGLLLRLDHAPAKSLAFKPVDRDTFQFSRMTVRFQRDSAGKIIALDYTNPALRNVKFTRLTDAN